MGRQPKDAKLDLLAKQGCNIAQFVSYGPQGEQRFSRVRGSNPNSAWPSVAEAVKAIYRTQSSPSVNIRSFLPDKPENNPFIFGIKDAKEAELEAWDLNHQGLYIIINETVGVRDGGFSGVFLGDAMEVAPFDTPRCVEKP